MAYSVLYSKTSSYRYKIPHVTEKGPFDHWMDFGRKPVIFSHNDHFGPDICTHIHFIPDASTLFGTLLYIYNGDYTDYTVCARVLIHKDTKTLYILNSVFDFDYYSLTSDEKDVHIKGAGLRSVKQFFACRRDDEDCFQKMTSMFFGNGWHVHRGFKDCHKKNLYKQFLKKARNIDGLIEDIHSEIAKALLGQWDKVSLVTKDEVDPFKELVKAHIGAAASEWGTYYAWSCVIGVFT
jgi:hypothetical protein